MLAMSCTLKCPEEMLAGNSMRFKFLGHSTMDVITYSIHTACELRERSSEFLDFGLCTKPGRKDGIVCLENEISTTRSRLWSRRSSWSWSCYDRVQFSSLVLFVLILQLWLTVNMFMRIWNIWWIDMCLTYFPVGSELMLLLTCMYAKCGCMDDACQIFKNMPALEY